jgi:hypothetical protein
VSVPLPAGCNHTGSNDSRKAITEVGMVVMRGYGFGGFGTAG